MSLLTVIFVAVGLSMDNFAVSMASGCAPDIKTKHIVKCGLIFVIAHFIMFSGGWFGGATLGKHIDAYDHWVAFALLLFIGGKMIYESFSKEEDECLNIVATGKKIFFISIATSLDALAVGISLSLSNVNFWLAVASISFFVFATTFAGFKLGSGIGKRLGPKAEVFGGVVLIAIGIKILLDGLM
ncbi:putative Mn2+ efflux pump MntP [Elusimicrobium simillimum]|uniref:manganese efflux pump MntP n=1 Tax=Elusimicrobium simillimum TaxID=3143438 RepID=UPI003C6F3C2F